MKKWTAIGWLLAIFCAPRMQVRAAENASVNSAPTNVRQTMPSGAISLRWQKQPISPNETVWLHLYCKPNGRADEASNMLGLEKRTGSITRADVTPVPGIKISPFWLDIWHLSAQKWQRLSSVRYRQNKDVNQIVLRWLDPKNKIGPIVLLNSGFTHWYEWDVFTFAKGWQQTPAHQQFGWGGEGGNGIYQRFDQTRNGRTVIVETEIENEREIQHLYHWNGREWNDATQKFFLIAATTRTRVEAEKWRDTQGWGEVLRSADYPKLKAGYFVVALERFRSRQEAEARARALKKDRKMETYVRRALP